MTLILKRSEIAKDFITAGQENVGIRVPSHPVALALLSEFEKLGGLGVAAPSANRFGAVSPTSSVDVQEEIGNYLQDTDQIIDGGQSIVGIESTIINCLTDLPVVLRPGAITLDLISSLIGFNINIVHTLNNLKVSGLLSSHYSPKAEVIIGGIPEAGEGFLALSDIPTPLGAIRLAAPNTIEQYARVLYQSIRAGDQKGLKKIIVILPKGSGMALAIRDRLQKAAN
jgi:L-threonylcarbamoyladenylate synthase